MLIWYFHTRWNLHDPSFNYIFLVGSLVQWLYRQWYRQESITAAGTRVEPPTRYHVRKWSAFKIGHFGKYYLFSDAGKQNVCSLFFSSFFFFCSRRLHLLYNGMVDIRWTFWKQKRCSRRPGSSWNWIEIAWKNLFFHLSLTWWFTFWITSLKLGKRKCENDLQTRLENKIIKMGFSHLKFDGKPVNSFQD